MSNEDMSVELSGSRVGTACQNNYIKEGIATA